MAEKKKKPWVNYITPEARAIYVNVFEKRERLNGKEAYSIVLLFPKSDKAGIKEMKKVMLACAKESKDLKDVNPKKIDWCLRDGDDKEDPTFHGNYYMNVWSYYQPGVITKTGRPITDPDDFYPGVWCRASITFWGYAKPNPGVSASLNNLMKVRDDERLGGASNPLDDFADYVEEGDEDDDELLAKGQTETKGKAEEEDDDLPF